MTNNYLFNVGEMGVNLLGLTTDIEEKPTTRPTGILDSKGRMIHRKISHEPVGFAITTQHKTGEQ